MSKFLDDLCDADRLMNPKTRTAARLERDTTTVYEAYTEMLRGES